MFFFHVFNCWLQDNPVSHETWVEKYGHVMKVRGFCNVRVAFSAIYNTSYILRTQQFRPCTSDPKAINYILSHSNDFQKTELARYSLSRILGAGLSAFPFHFLVLM